MAFTCIHTKAHGIYMHKHIHERVYVRLHVLVVDEKLIVIPVLVDSDHVDEQVLGSVGSVLKILHCFATHPYGKREGRRRVGEAEEQQNKMCLYSIILHLYSIIIYILYYIWEKQLTGKFLIKLSLVLSLPRELSLSQRIAQGEGRYIIVTYIEKVCLFPTGLLRAEIKRRGGIHNRKDTAMLTRGGLTRALTQHAVTHIL